MTAKEQIDHIRTLELVFYYFNRETQKKPRSYTNQKPRLSLTPVPEAGFRHALLQLDIRKYISMSSMLHYRLKVNYEKGKQMP